MFLDTANSSSECCSLFSSFVASVYVSDNFPYVPSLFDSNNCEHIPFGSIRLTSEEGLYPPLHIHRNKGVGPDCVGLLNLLLSLRSGCSHYSGSYLILNQFLSPGLSATSKTNEEFLQIDLWVSLVTLSNHLASYI